MTYNKTTWVNKKTALSAANLNNMENGLENVDSRTTKLEEDIKNIDVSEQINEHNISVTSHQDIRSAIENIDVSTQINTHNSNSDAHSLILGSVALSTEDKTVKGAINETLNKVDVLSINVGDTTTLKTDSKKVVGGINESVDKITDLQTSKADKNNPSFTGTMMLNENQVSTNVAGNILIKQDLGITSVFLTPKVIINGNTFTISGGLKLTKPLAEGTVVMSLPSGIVPQFSYHIFFNSWNYAIPPSCRLWVDTDGNIKIYGASQLPTQSIDLDFSRTVTF